MIEESHEAIFILADHQEQAQEGKHPKIMKNKGPITNMKNLKIFEGASTMKNLLGEKIENNITAMKNMNLLLSEKNRRLLQGTRTAKNYQSIKIMVSLSRQGMSPTIDGINHHISKEQKHRNRSWKVPR
jgi:hypothetical protein